MKLFGALTALALLMAASSGAQAATYVVTYQNLHDGYDPSVPDIITGTLTEVGGTVTSFVGTAQGFDGDNSIFDGPLSLATSAGSSGFTFDNKWVGGHYGVDNVGLLLTNGPFYFRIYDYTDQYNDYGVQAAWFGQSGYNPVFASGVPEPGVWAMLLVGFFALGSVLRSRRKPLKGVAAA